MPKQLKDIESLIIEKGRELLFSADYSDFSMRKVADSCGIAVGTIYNYVKNKDDLIAKSALLDWNNCIKNIKVGIEQNPNFVDASNVIYKEVAYFRNLYSRFFSSYADKYGSDNTIRLYHPYLRKSIQGFVEPLLDNIEPHNKDLVAPVISEIILSCATHNDISEEQFITFLKMINTGGKNE